MRGNTVRPDDAARTRRPEDHGLPAALGRAGVFLALVLLCGCAGDTDFGARAFAVQGKHEWRSCEQLIALQDSMTKQIDELQAVMAKASRDSGGGIVNATVHGPTLVGLQADRRLLRETIAEKNCTAPAPPGR